MKALIALAAIVLDVVLCSASLNASEHGNMHRALLWFALALTMSACAGVIIMSEEGE